MFGYVRPPLRELPQEEQDRFRRIYCGLCRTLKKRYGTAASFILNYDFTYLAILLSCAEEEECLHGKCIVHPIQGCKFFESSKAVELAADESVILAYWQLRDGVSDHSWLHGFKYRLLSSVLKPAYRRAAACLPEFDSHTKQQLQFLAELEEQRCPSMDQAADTFAHLLGAAAEEVDDPIRQRILGQLLYHLGRWIYLVDAADDMKKDAVSGNYNPVALRYGIADGVWTPEARLDFANTLDHSIHMMTTAYELWDFGVWGPILESTLYTGLFQVGKAVLDGSYRTIQWKRKRKNNRNFEEST